MAAPTAATARRYRSLPRFYSFTPKLPVQLAAACALFFSLGLKCACCTESPNFAEAAEAGRETVCDGDAFLQVGARIARPEVPSQEVWDESIERLTAAGRGAETLVEAEVRTAVARAASSLFANGSTWMCNYSESANFRHCIGQCFHKLPHGADDYGDQWCGNASTLRDYEFKESVEAFECSGCWCCLV
eukprot:CAMPEP_0178442228 /NCGR_PEP_ID=MMETSP0689_2-20121128/38025_1 /TAXON_ID=160604 /ORGANISM="Amphidinium massartii, Strain CS-259" /LENGTH=188 /DNA_ID=CAMNT_0020065705 /DNA_START=47 /DNA_END=613 /DNA_ORIENTATION=+